MQRRWRQTDRKKETSRDEDGERPTPGWPNPGSRGTNREEAQVWGWQTPVGFQEEVWNSGLVRSESRGWIRVRAGVTGEERKREEAERQDGSRRKQEVQQAMARLLSPGILQRRSGTNTHEHPTVRMEAAGAAAAAAPHSICKVKSSGDRDAVHARSCALRLTDRAGLQPSLLLKSAAWPGAEEHPANSLCLISVLSAPWPGSLVTWVMPSLTRKEGRPSFATSLLPGQQEDGGTVQALFHYCTKIVIMTNYPFFTWIKYFFMYLYITLKIHFCYHGHRIGYSKCTSYTLYVLVHL